MEQRKYFTSETYKRMGTTKYKLKYMLKSNKYNIDKVISMLKTQAALVKTSKLISFYDEMLENAYEYKKLITKKS